MLYIKQNFSESEVPIVYVVGVGLLKGEADDFNLATACQILGYQGPQEIEQQKHFFFEKYVCNEDVNGNRSDITQEQFDAEWTTYINDYLISNGVEPKEYMITPPIRNMGLRQVRNFLLEHNYLTPDSHDES